MRSAEKEKKAKGRVSVISKVVMLVLGGLFIDRASGKLKRERDGK